MRSALLMRTGAVGDDVARHYGEPLSEQRLLLAGQALVDCSNWSVLTLTGPDRLSWLDAIASQVFVGLSAGHTAEGLILDPNGRIEHQFLLSDDGDTAWLLVEPGRAAALLAWLERMRFRAQVDIEDVSEDWATLATLDLDAPGRLGGAVGWLDAWPRVAQGGVAYSADPHPASGVEVTYFVIPRHSLAADLSQAWAGSDALEAIRVAAGRPSIRFEVDEKTLPHELDWLRTAVHMDKGCYRGQETVAKVHNLGHPPRRLTLLHLDGSGSVLPEPGAEVSAGENSVGYLTRAVWHFELGPIALAVLKRTLDPEAELVVAGPEGAISARQEILVSPDAGATRREALRARRGPSAV